MKDFSNKTHIIRNCSYFNLPATLDCGQAFRWKAEGNGYFGIAAGRPLYLERQGQDIVLTGCDEREFETFWKSYFDLEFDYEGLIASKKSDPYITAGAEFGSGQRLLHQQHFEALVSFILSANNNLKRIKGIIERLCAAYGKEVLPGVFAFPTAEELKNVTAEEYRQLGAGYRAPYLEKTVGMINDGFDLDAIETMPYVQAKKRLMALAGVGGKVADCVLLYGYGFREAFPQDVWVKRIVSALYFSSEPTVKQIEDFAKNTFGKDAGVLQLFLFHYARHNFSAIDREKRI